MTALFRLIACWCTALLVLTSITAFANPVIIFNAGAENNPDAKPLLRVPQTGMVSLQVVTSACRLGRGGDLRVYDLATGECAEQAGVGRPVANNPALDQPLAGGQLTGQSVQTALDAGLFVWYDLRTSSACVIGACFQTSDVKFVPVVIESFTATPESIEIGDTATLQWITTGASSCTLSGGQGCQTQTVPTTGSDVRFPVMTNTYSLSCQNDQTSASAEAMVMVAEDDQILFLNSFDCD